MREIIIFTVLFMVFGYEVYKRIYIAAFKDGYRKACGIKKIKKEKRGFSMENFSEKIFNGSGHFFKFIMPIGALYLVIIIIELFLVKNSIIYPNVCTLISASIAFNLYYQYKRKLEKKINWFN